MVNPHKKPTELPDEPRIEQLKAWLNDLLFAIMACVETYYGKVAKICSQAFDWLPVSESTAKPLKKLFKLASLIIGVTFLVYVVFVWLNPLLGFFCIAGLAAAIFYWPEIAFTFREYQERKHNKN